MTDFDEPFDYEAEEPAVSEDGEVKGLAPVTITLNLDEMLERLFPDFEGEPDNLRGQVMAMVAHKLMQNHLQYDGIRKEISDAVDVHMEKIVSEALEQSFQRLNDYGNPKGEPTTLREEIIKRSTERLASAMQPADRYDSDRTRGAVKKYIDDAIGSAFEKELRGVLESAKKTALEAVKKKAAEFMTQAFAEVADKVNKS